MWSTEEKPPYGNLALRAGTGLEFTNFFHTGKTSKFVVFVLGAVVPSVGNLQLCSLSALNGVIKFRLSQCAEQRKGIEKVWKHLLQKAKT